MTDTYETFCQEVESRNAAAQAAWGAAAPVCAAMVEEWKESAEYDVEYYNKSARINPGGFSALDALRLQWAERTITHCLRWLSENS